MAELKKIQIKDMRVNDTIAVAYSLNIGWNRRYRYPIWRVETIKRITPKKTKVVTDRGEYTKDTIFAIPSDETERQTSVTKAMYESNEMSDKLARLDKSGQPDDIILEIHRHLAEIVNLTNKDGKMSEYWDASKS